MSKFINRVFSSLVIVFFILICCSSITNAGYYYDSKFGSSGSGDGQMDAPFGVSFDSNGDIYVAEFGNDRIQKFNSSGVYQSQFGSHGTGDGKFNGPAAVAVDSSGNIFVVDVINSRIQKFNSSGVYQSQFGSHGTGDGEFNHPNSIEIDSSGNIFVVDQGNNRVQKFNSSGVYQSEFGTEGSGDGEFAVPSDLAFDSSGNIFIADYGNNRVQKFNSSGVYQSEFGTEGSGDGEFNHPTGIAIDSSGNIFVVDEDNDRIQEFNSSGVYRFQFGTNGNNNGEFDRPVAIAIDSSGNVFVVDEGNDRIQKFAYNFVNFSDTSLSLTEGTETTYSVALDSEPSADVTITLSKSTPLAGSGVTLSPTVLIFTSENWDDSQTVTVTAVDDDDYDGGRSLDISSVAESSDETFDGVSIPDIKVNISDDEAGLLLVNSLLDDGDGTCTVEKCTFRDAVANAGVGDTINFDLTPGSTILLTTSDSINIGVPLTIEGPGQDDLTIDFNGDDSTYIEIDTVGGEVNISGLTFTNAPDTVFYHGGDDTTNVNISDSTFNDNDDGYEPIYASYGDWNIYNVIFSNNDACNFTGAIYFISNGTLSIVNSAFINNSSCDKYGGAIYFEGGSMTVSNTMFAGNDAQGGDGSALYLYGPTTVDIDNSTFTANLNGYGVINSHVNELNITNSTFAGNDNTVDGGSAGIYNEEGVTNIVNSTFYNNINHGYSTLSDVGDGINIVNSIIYSGTDDHCDGVTSLGHNITSGESCEFVSEGDSHADPLLYSGGLADNGGEVMTIALLESSPAIDAADDEAAPETDARGFSRPVGAHADIGAFEFGATAVHTLTVIKSGSGGGTVTSTPSGISCGITCTEDYSDGTVITLASSAASGSTFTGWSGGGCSGTGSCVVTLNSDKSVTATFNLAASGGSGGSHHSSSAGGRVSVTPQAPTINPTDCLAGYKFSPSTGKPCNSSTTLLPSDQEQSPSCSISSNLLKMGARGYDVKCLQTLLKLIEVDGIFGPKTKAAVITFQIGKGLIPDGIVGFKTKIALGV